MAAAVPPTIFARTVRIAALCGTLLAGAQSALAVPYTSNADGSWETPTTWLPNGIPAAGDDVQINHVVTLGGTSAVDDVVVGAGGDLQLGIFALSINGDLTVTGGGIFTKGTNTLGFTGSGPQLITGALDLHSVVINNSAATPSDTDAVVATDPWTCSGFLLLQDGQFNPSDGSEFLNVNILAPGILKSPFAGELGITGASGVTAFSNSGSFLHNGGKLTFTGSGPQGISPTAFTTFHDLEVANTAPAPDTDNDVAFTNSNCEVVGTVTVLDGMFSIASSIHDVSIGADGILNLLSFTNVSGDWDTASGATFIPNSFTLTFNGTGRQEITGETTFGTLTIANTAASPDDTNAVVALDPVHSTGQLRINDGQFMPADGSSFRNILIEIDGILKPAAAAEAIVNGASGGTGFSNSGSFVHNGGKLTFTGSGSQSIFTSAFTTFNDIEVANTAPTPDTTSDVAITSFSCEAVGTLTVLDGMFSIASNFHDVSVGADGILNVIAATNISGDWAMAPGATFIPGSTTLTLNGTGRQEISGEPTFGTITITNTAASPDDTNAVVALDPVHSLGQLSVNDGQFMPADGSSFRNIFVAASGILKPVAGAETIVSGDSGGTGFSNSGSFVHNGGKLTFTGSGSQSIFTSAFTTFNDIEVANTAPTPDTTSDVAITSFSCEAVGTLTVLDGMFSIASNFHDVSVGADGILNVVATTGVSGDWAMAPGAMFIPGVSTLSFNGTGRQEISGEPTFGFLTILNSAAAPDDTNAVVGLDPVHSTGRLLVAEGQFMPASGSSFRDIDIDPSGIFKPVAGAETIVNGSSGGTGFSNSGSFVHNGGKMTFTGSGSQSIFTSAFTTFNDIEVANTAPTPDTDNDVAITSFSCEAVGTLTVLDGMFSIASNFHDVSVGADGILNVISATNVSGDWSMAPGATFTPGSSTLSFNGTGRQEISGEPTFGALTIANGAASPDDTDAVVGLDPVHTTSQLVVSDGQFMPASGSSFRNITVNPSGILKPAAGAETIINGAFGTTSMTVAGAFVHNGGTVRFTGNASQSTGVGAYTFNNFTVENTAPTPDADNDVTVGVPIEGTLLILDGMLTPYSNARAHDVTIGADGILNLFGGDFAVSGDFTLDAGGTFLANSIPVTFDGSAQQIIDGGPAFDTLNIANTGARGADRGTPNSVIALDPLTATTALNVTDGRFVPGGPATFGDTFVGVDGTFDPFNLAVLTFTGDLVNSGTLLFSPNDVRFEGTGVQRLGSDSAADFGTLYIGASSILNEVGTADNFTINGTTTNDGILRRTRAVAGPGVVTGGLTGASLNFADAGTVATLVIDRIESVPNATADHLEPASWTFDVGAGGAYDVAVTLPHALGDASRATVSRYLGTGTDWDFVQTSFTVTDVTRAGVTDLTSRWAVADRDNATVTDWIVLD